MPKEGRAEGKNRPPWGPFINYVCKMLASFGLSPFSAFVPYFNCFLGNPPPAPQCGHQLCMSPCLPCLSLPCLPACLRALSAGCNFFCPDTSLYCSLPKYKNISQTILSEWGQGFAQGWIWIAQGIIIPRFVRLCVAEVTHPLCVLLSR